MFITHIVVGNSVLERSIFLDLEKAVNYAHEATTHKVWEIGDRQFYYGNVDARIYQPKLRVTSDHVDEHILSISHSHGNRGDVM
jgi:hypothetical protein